MSLKNMTDYKSDKVKKYIVTGMSCQVCSLKVEKTVSNVEGVEKCTVNLLTNTMIVEGNVNASDIINAVDKAGYKATEWQKSGNAISGNKSSGKNNSFDEEVEFEKQIDSEYKKLKKRLVYSLGFLIVLMYFSMGFVMWDMPLPRFLEENLLIVGIIQMILSMIILIINRKFFISGYKALISRTPNMDTLVAIGSTAAYVYSLMSIDEMIIGTIFDNPYKIDEYLHELYFESAAMILVLITVGKMLEARSKGKTTNAIKSLMKLKPEKANIIKDGKIEEIFVNEINEGDVFVVKSGECIPTDGIIVYGNATINESMLTGESIPVDKKLNDIVSGATICETGYIKCEATRVGEDTTLSKIIQLVSEASSMKAPIAKIADKVSGVFVPIVIIISLITFCVWMFTGARTGFALSRAIAVLVISCPCALGLATPVAIMVGNGIGAKNGILFKTAESLETLGKVNIVAFDKTGTITTGKMTVTDVYSTENCSKDELWELAYLLEKLSEHPIAKAIVDSYEMNYGINGKENEVADYVVHPGNGISGVINNRKIWVGNQKFINKICEIHLVSNEVSNKVNRFADEGKTPIWICTNDEVLGIIGVADTIKEDSIIAIKALKKMGIKSVMITGDNSRTAKYIANEAGIEDVVSEVLPLDKEKTIQELKKNGVVAMVGDGINDAPALTSADIGIAIGAGTEIAIESANVVLMKDTLIDVVAAVQLSKKTIRNIKENLFWAFCYNIVGIPLAAGVFMRNLEIELSPMLGALAMGLSSFCVVSNALRLNYTNIYKGIDLSEIQKNKEDIVEKEQETNMKKVINIKGMMCKHCEANVKKILEGLDGVISAEVSHETGMAEVMMESEIDNEVFVKVISDNDYEVISIE